ncbi:septum formation initiator family protein [Sporosalibacterium faouarense]|uniref:FtsB family cell division protein n=1 Tax=Sporosalibacterium faouarense TaxID=516123 RepID=UPI00311CC6CD
MKDWCIMEKRPVRKKRKKIRIRYIFFLIIFIYGISSFFNQQGMLNELDNKKAIKEKEVRKLTQEIEELEDKIKYSNTPEYVEKIARDELGMVKPWEVIFIDKNKNKFIKGLKD